MKMNTFGVKKCDIHPHVTISGRGRGRGRRGRYCGWYACRRLASLSALPFRIRFDQFALYHAQSIRAFLPLASYSKIAVLWKIRFGLGAGAVTQLKIMPLAHRTIARIVKDNKGWNRE